MLRRGVVALSLLAAVNMTVVVASGAQANARGPRPTVGQSAARLVTARNSAPSAQGLLEFVRSSGIRRQGGKPQFARTGAGVWAASPMSASPCAVQAFTDPSGDGIVVLDADSYFLGYDCVKKVWAVAVHVGGAQKVTPVLIDEFLMLVDRDQNAKTGNGGFDVAIVGRYNAANGFVAVAVETPTSDRNAWSVRPEDVALSLDDNNDVQMAFPDSVLGSPRFDWGLLITPFVQNSVYADVMPNSGLNTTTRPTAPPKPAPAVLNSSANVFRPSTGTWYSRGGHNAQFGQAGDVPVPADYFGDHKRHVAVFRPSNGTWYVHGGRTTRFGQAGDVPVPADFNGDGKADIAVYRPSNGTWYIAGHRGLRYGAPGDIPVAADFNGDGKAEIAVFRPSNGTWYIAGHRGLRYGAPGDIPVAADFNGDGKAEIAVFRPSRGTWFVRGGHTYHWGLVGDVPIARDFNGDGTSEIAIFRPSNGRWYIRNVQNVSYGQNGDIPL